MIRLLNVFFVVLAFSVLPVKGYSESIRWCPEYDPWYQFGFNPSIKARKYVKDDLINSSKVYVHPYFWDDPVLRSNLLEAAEEWNSHIGSGNHVTLASYREHPERDWNNKFKEVNGYSEIYPSWTLPSRYVSPQDYGVSLGQYVQRVSDVTSGGNCSVEQFDIFLNGTTPWDRQTTKLYSYDRETKLIYHTTNLKSVVLHELGHLYGHEHYDGVTKVLNSLYPNGGSLGVGEVSLYGADLRLAHTVYDRDVVNDVAASSFVRESNSQFEKAYSAKMIFDGSWSDVVVKDEGALIPLHIVNRSNLFQSVIVDIFISSDTVFSNGERVGRELVTLSPYEQKVIGKWVTPKNAGNYYFGYKITSNDDIPSNNTTKLPYKVKVCSNRSRTACGELY